MLTPIYKVNVARRRRNASLTLDSTAPTVARYMSNKLAKLGDAIAISKSLTH